MVVEGLRLRLGEELEDEGGGFGGRGALEGVEGDGGVGD